MTVIETNNNLIFSGDELKKYWKREIVWNIGGGYYDKEFIDIVDGSGNIIGQKRVVKNLNISGDKPTREILFITDEGTPFEEEKWEKEEGRWEEKGNENTFYISEELQKAMAELFGDNDFLQNKYNNIHFIEGVFSDEFLKGGFMSKFFVIDKKYLKEEIWEVMYSITGLSSTNDGELVMIIENDFSEIDQIIQSDGGITKEWKKNNGFTHSSATSSATGGEIKDIDIEALKNLESSVGYKEKDLDYINFNSEEIREVARKAEILDNEIFPIASKIRPLKEIMSSDIGEERENKQKHNNEQLELRRNFAELMKKLLGQESETKNPGSNFPPPNTKNQNLKELRIAVITEISQFLNKEPKITDQELEENNREWKNSIENINSSNQINDLRDKVLADIRGKRQEKVNSNKLSELVEEGQETENYEKLKKLVEQIEKFRGEENYKLLENKINVIKGRLAQKNPVEYCMTVFKMIEEEMMTKSVKKDELDTAVKKELEKLEKGEINDPVKIDAVKNKISDNIGKINAEKILVELIKKYQKSPNENSKKIAKKKLLNFISNKNHFYKNAYRTRKSEVNNMLGISSNHQSTSSKNDFPLVPVILIGSFFVFLICSAIIIRKRRIIKKKNKL